MNLKLLNHQWDAINSHKKFTCLLGGIGAGKTFTGFAWVLKKLKETPESLDLITANTYGQLQKATLSSLFKNLDSFGIPYNYNQNKSLLSIGTKRFLCLATEAYDNHRGIEVGSWWGDEAAYYTRKQFEVLAGRIRDKNGKLDVLFTTTPKGFNWLYDRFSPDGELHDPLTYHVVKAPTRSNYHLPNDYENMLKDQYDDLLLKQELEGEFINVTAGRIYYAFNRDDHVMDIKINPSYPLWVGVDFNIDPMTATIGQIIGDKLYIVDEVYLRNSNTEALSREIVSKYGRNCTIVPDSTGIKRTTNANKSDIQILKSFFSKVYTAGNPFRIDRYAAVNGAFSKGKVVISPRCKYTIKDLESVVYKEGTDQPDTSDRMLTHASDNLGYLIYRTVNPLKNKVRPVVME